MTRIRIGTRGSHLARTQTGTIAAALTALGHEVEVIIIRTRGDELQKESGAHAPSNLTTGLFTKALEQAMARGEVDAAVHSLKDLPCILEEGFEIAAIPEREDPADALCSKGGEGLADLPRGARVGTGSPRRRALLRAARPDLEVVPIRGNIDTRLGRLNEPVEDGGLDAVVLALSGLRRGGFADRVSERLSLLPAPGQGALAVECRADDAATIQALAALDHAPTRAAVAAERALHLALGGGCLSPLGALASLDSDGRISLAAAVASLDGKRLARAEAAGDEAASLVSAVAAELEAQDAREILAAARRILEAR